MPPGYLPPRRSEHDGRLLAAMLGGGTGEHTANLADQRALHPEAAGPVEEVPHLRAHFAEARGRSEEAGPVTNRPVCPQPCEARVDRRQPIGEATQQQRQ